MRSILDVQFRFLNFGVIDQLCSNQPFVPRLKLAPLFPNCSGTMNADKASPALHKLLERRLFFGGHDRPFVAAVVVKHDHIKALQIRCGQT